jgi:phage N-6-adenine-methyltransferase
MTAPKDNDNTGDSNAVSVESTALFGISDASLRLRQMSIRSAVAFPGKSGKTNYSDEWYTPPRIVSALGPFDLDPSAGPMNHAARNIRHPEECGLAVEWSGRVWLNPPYSNVHLWLAKFAEHGDGITLVNARPETQWFQRLVANAAAVHWLRGRIQFDMPEGPSKHPTVGSVLVAYGERNAAALLSSGLPGVVMRVESNIPNAGILP